MTTVDTLATKFILTGDYAAQAAKNTAATSKFAQAQISAQNSTKRAAGVFGSQFDDLEDWAKSAMNQLDPLKNVLLGIFGAGAGAVAGGYSLMKQAAEFDSLKQSLISVEGSARAAGDALKRLKELAKAPGLGFGEAVQAYTGLRNAGLGQQFADQIIKEFANANARGGGNAETFGRILTQIRQASGRQFLAQEDLTPIGEAGIPINKILKDAFGTGDTEELKKKGIDAQTALRGIVAELAKLKRVAGGQQNEFDNLADALQFAQVAAGDALNKGLLPFVSEFADSVSKFTENGVIASAFEGIANNVVEILSDGGKGIDTALKDFLVSLQTASGGGRNLVENAKGLFGFLAPLIDGGLFGRLNKLLGDDFDYSLDAEQKRNERTAEMQAEAADKQKALRDRMSAKGLKPDGTPLDKPKSEAATKAEKSNQLLQMIAVNTGRMADQLEDASSGGGSLTDYAINARNLSSVVGGYNRRFRMAGQ